MVSELFDADVWDEVPGFDLTDITYHRAKAHGTVRVAFDRPEVRNAFRPSTVDFFPATIEANRWRGALFGLPWFVDAGMLYWRTDLLPTQAELPLEALVAAACRVFLDEQRATAEGGLSHVYSVSGCRAAR